MLDANDRRTAGAGGYPVSPVTLEHARVALARVHPTTAGQVWADLLAEAGLSGREVDRAALEQLLDAMSASAAPLTALCARALRIRLSTFDRLSAVRSMRALVEEQIR